MIADDEKAGLTMKLGKAHMHLTLTNHYESAISETMKEYQMRPENIDVNKALAEAHYHKGNLSKASEHLKIATRTNSEDPQLLLLAGLIKMKNEQSTATALLRQSLKVNPYQTGALATTAKAYLKGS